MRMPSMICFWLETQEMARAFSRAWAKTGKRIAMMAITTSSSMSVKPDDFVWLLREYMTVPPECRERTCSNTSIRTHMLYVRMDRNYATRHRLTRSLDAMDADHLL